MASLTQSDILSNIRSKLDELEAGVWSDLMLRGWVNEAMDDIARRTECLRGVDNAIAVTAGVQEYSAPSSAFRLHAVIYQRDGDERVYPLKYVPYANMVQMGVGSMMQTNSTPSLFWTWGHPPSLKINLYPIPAQDGTLTVHFYAMPTRLATADDSDASTSVDIPQGWEDLITDYAVFQAMMMGRDPRWQQYMQFYETHLDVLSASSEHYIDANNMITTDAGAGIPEWLWNPNYTD